MARKSKKTTVETPVVEIPVVCEGMEDLYVAEQELCPVVVPSCKPAKPANRLSAVSGIGQYTGQALIEWSRGWSEGQALLLNLELPTDADLQPLPYGGKSTIE